MFANGPKGDSRPRTSLIAAFQAGDDFARECWLQSVRVLACAIASFVNVLDPEAVIIGGGIAAAGDALFVPLAAELEAIEWRPAGHAVKLIPAELGEWAGAIGAARTASSTSRELRKRIRDELKPLPGAFALLAALSFASTGISVAAEETKLSIVDTRKIWDGAPHNAFTDLIRFGDAWICVFRESTSHVPGTNGVIRVLRSSDTKTWESVAAVSENGVDLRDPKVSIAPDGRLMLLAGGSIYDGEDGQPKRKLTGASTRAFFSSDALTWTAPAVVDLARGRVALAHYLARGHRLRRLVLDEKRRKIRRDALEEQRRCSLREDRAARSALCPERDDRPLYAGRDDAGAGPR
jgi:hypothetical protein